MVTVKDLIRQLDKEAMTRDLLEISRIPAINPRMNGAGEYQRMQWIARTLEARGIPYRIIEVADEAAPEGVRLNIVSSFPGTADTEKTLWFIAHVDTVHTGDLALWNSNPLDPQVSGGKVYGLGVEDNTQAVITGLQVATLLQESGLRAQCNIGFLFVSDEETGSKYGLHALIEEGTVFSARDEAVVPDGGSPDGAFVEIAEKSQVWLRITVNGKQGHAAMPDHGINACSIGMHLGVDLEDLLKREFSARDGLFNPPYSSFELTQKFANVESPNVLPGQDVFTLDMRILPCYTVDQVMLAIQGKVDEYLQAHAGVTIELKFVTCVEAPPPTPQDAPVVQGIMNVLKELGVDAYYGGIGGGTCAAILRAHHIPAVVWSTLDELAHQANEYCVIDNLQRDASVFLALIGKYC